VSPGARLTLPWPPGFNALAYVLAGQGSAGAERRPLVAGQLAVFGAGEDLSLAAAAVQDGHSPTLEVLVLGGLPIREPVAHYGPFVMNTRAEILQAMEDYQAGRLGVIPAEHLPHADDGTAPTETGPLRQSSHRCELLGQEGQAHPEAEDHRTTDHVEKEVVGGNGDHEEGHHRVCDQ